jgi:hypothetical protein
MLFSRKIQTAKERKISLLQLATVNRDRPLHFVMERFAAGSPFFLLQHAARSHDSTLLN